MVPVPVFAERPVLYKNADFSAWLQTRLLLGFYLVFLSSSQSLSLSSKCGRAFLMGVAVRVEPRQHSFNEVSVNAVHA